MAKKIIKDQTYQSERALYNLDDASVISCRFEGEEDGESPFKEGKNYLVEDCYIALRYPFWHGKNFSVSTSTLSSSCRAPFWYDENFIISGCSILGVKAIRECKEVMINGSTIESEEFGWMVDGLMIRDSSIKSVYPFMRVRDIDLHNVRLEGKYSFQYCKKGKIRDCRFKTKDAFWHSEDLLIEDCLIEGEYIGWYSKNLTFKNCTIISHQGFCYCEGLKIIDCDLEGCDLAFERSEVDVYVKGKIDSVKNPLKGKIEADEIGEIILDGDIVSKAKIKSRKA